MVSVKGSGLFFVGGGTSVLGSLTWRGEVRWWAWGGGPVLGFGGGV
jgi:hypothetical protein